MRYFTIKRGDKHCLVKQCNHGPRFWLTNLNDRPVGYKSAVTANGIAGFMQDANEEGCLLSGERWVEEGVTTQGGRGSPRFGGASA